MTAPDHARMLEGIDVSHHNTVATVPWEGIDFAFVRASYGVTPDTQAEAHLDHLAAVPVRALYTYLESGPHAASGEAQAAFFLDRHAALVERFGPLGMAVDTEQLPKAPPDPPARVRAILMGFAAAVLDAGPTCFMYGSRVWLAELHLPEWFASRFPLWAASKAPWPAPWTVATVLQDGVRGVDRDRFNGTVDELRAVMGLGATGPLGCALPGPL